MSNDDTQDEDDTCPHCGGPILEHGQGRLRWCNDCGRELDADPEVDGGEG